MRVVLAAAMAGFVGLGCSSGGASGAVTQEVTAEQACTDLSNALCGKIEACLPIYLQIGWGDGATCRERSKKHCLQDLAAPGTGAKPADLAECAKAAPATSCQDLLDNKGPAACLPKQGTVDNGKNCTADAQCKSAFCSLDDEKAVCGVCADKPAAGASCGSDKKCPSGLVCAPNKKCATPVAEGGDCDDARPCSFGTSCASGKCTKNVAVEGAACGGTLPQCDAAKGLFCILQKCHKITLAPVGAECGVRGEGTLPDVKITAIVGCEKAGYCKGSNSKTWPPVPGKCEPAAKDGEACAAGDDLDVGPKCLEPAECVDGRCVFPDVASCK